MTDATRKRAAGSFESCDSDPTAKNTKIMEEVEDETIPTTNVSSSIKTSDHQLEENTNATAVSQNVRKLTSGFFQAALENVNFDRAEAVALIRALTSYFANTDALELIGLFSYSATDINNDEVGEKAWENVLKESTYYKSQSTKRLKIRYAATGYNKARDYYSWTTLDHDSTKPEFCTFLAVFMYMMLYAKDETFPDHPKSDIIQAIAKASLNATFGYDVQITVQLDFESMDIEESDFPNAENCSIVNAPFQLPDMNEEVIDKDSNLYKAFETTNRAFQAYKTTGEEFNEKAKAYCLMSERMSKQFAKVMDSFEEYSAARVLYLEVGQKILKRNLEELSNDDLLREVTERLPKSTDFERNVTQMLKDAINSKKTAAAFGGRDNENLLNPQNPKITSADQNLEAVHDGEEAEN